MIPRIMPFKCHQIPFSSVTINKVFIYLKYFKFFLFHKNECKMENCTALYYRNKQHSSLTTVTQMKVILCALRGNFSFNLSSSSMGSILKGKYV
jgi:hypothetical protein